MTARKTRLPALLLAESDPPVPIHLFRHQFPTLRVWGEVAMSAWKPLPRAVPAQHNVTPIQCGVDAPAEEIMRWFVDWCGGPQDRYTDVVPPHLFAHWSLPVCARLMATTGYPLQRLVTRGISMRIEDDLPRGETLLIRVSLEEIRQIDGRVEFVQQIITSAAHRPQALITRVTSSLVTGRRGPRQPRGLQVEGLEKLKSWHMVEGDGLAFGLLCGDLNPVHWSGRYARFLGQKGRIAHAQALFARSYEALVNAGNDVREIELRFPVPVQLPADVELSAGSRMDEAGWRPVELHSQPGQRRHMSGRWR